MKPSAIVTMTAVALLVGGALGFMGSHHLGHDMSVMQGHSSHREASQGDSLVSSGEKEPLYWVAPMDPNYRRDKPGKSPMGMDLIPVYEEEGGRKQAQGTVRIDAAVENNLGVKTEQVIRENLSPDIETVGYINFDESRLFQTNLLVNGWVQELNVNTEGEKVRKGDVLFTLYSPELVKAQDDLLSAYRSGRKPLIRGAKERLLALGVDNAQINTIAQKGRTQQHIAIKAPADGVIAKLNVREGGYVSPAKTVITAGPLDEVWVDVEVFERQSHWINVGDQAEMRLDALPSQEWAGEIDYIYPMLNAKTRTLRVRLKFDNKELRLKPNMFANVLLKPKSDNHVLTIAKEAVIRSGNMTRVVLAEGEGKYRSARIKVGRETAHRIEVLEGLSEQDKVVTSAQFMLDSESSQRADLSRINGVDAVEASIWTTGEIIKVMPDHEMLTIRHDPIDAWQWPSMTMDFTLSKEVSLEGLKVGDLIDFEISKTDSGSYLMSEYKASDKEVINELWAEGDISMLMADFGMITIKHQAISQWGWEAGEMNFSVDVSNQTIKLTDFKEGDKIRFLIKKSGSDYQLNALEKTGGEQ